jgi:hypothetical protein
MHSFGIEAPRVLFAGPTLSALRDRDAAVRAGFQVLPPARRGDVLALLQREPGILVLVDGLFHLSLAVGHAELRRAIGGGWKVWGLCSMGAIRAYELRTLGMRGFGRIYDHFLADQDFQDDEVAQLHSPAPEYVAVTEPMIHLRYFLQGLDASEIIKHSEAQQIAGELKALWYGNRSLEVLISLIHRFSGATAAAVARSWLVDFDRFSVKTHDLHAFLQESIWLRESVEAAPVAAPYSTTSL